MKVYFQRAAGRARLAALALWAVRPLAGTLLAVLMASPANAQVTAVAGGSPDHIDLANAVTSTVAAHCGFSTSPSGTFQAGDLYQGFTHDFIFTLGCNEPARVAVQSAHGGLLTPNAPFLGYAALAPYSVTLNLVGDPGVASVNANCAAASLLLSGGCAFAGPASASLGLRLAGSSSAQTGSFLRVSAGPYAGSAPLLAATNYADTLTITVSGAP